MIRLGDDNYIKVKINMSLNFVFVSILYRIKKQCWRTQF